MRLALFQSVYFDSELQTLQIQRNWRCGESLHSAAHAAFPWTVSLHYAILCLRVANLWVVKVIKCMLKHSPSLQNFRWFDGSCRNENFCRSAYVSVSRPNRKSPVPVESKCVIVLGAWGCECRGEFTMMTGSDTTNTQTACSTEGKICQIEIDKSFKTFSPETSRRLRSEWRSVCYLQTACHVQSSRCDREDMQKVERPISIQKPSPSIAWSRSSAVDASKIWKRKENICPIYVHSWKLNDICWCRKKETAFKCIANTKFRKYIIHPDVKN